MTCVARAVTIFLRSAISSVWVCVVVGVVISDTWERVPCDEGVWGFRAVTSAQLNPDTGPALRERCGGASLYAAFPSFSIMES